VRRWPSGALLDLTVNGRLRRVVHCDAVHRPFFTVRYVEYRHPEFTYANWTNPPLPARSTDYSFPAAWLPAEYWAPEMKVAIRIIGLPYTATTMSTPILLDRNLTLVKAPTPPGPTRVTAR
jgi:hypothetical protein